MPDILPASCGWSDDYLTSKATSSFTCQGKYDKKEASPHGLASFILFIFFLSSFYFKTTFLPLMMTMPR
jgi:hypothetical protein